MSLRRPGTASRWVTALLTAGLLPLVPVQFQIVAAAVLGLHLTLLVRDDQPVEYLTVLVNTLALPFIASSLWRNPVVATLFVLPGLPWLEATLRRATPGEAVERPFPSLQSRRFLTRNAVVLIAGLTAQGLVSLLTGQLSFLLSAAVLLGFTAALAGISCLRIPPTFLTARAPTIRVLARDTVEATVTLSLNTLAGTRMLIETPNSWVGVLPRMFVADAGEAAIRLRLAPPLAGSKTIEARAIAVDPWGLVATQQSVALAHVHVIPRAVYATWLARRYLERAAGGQFAAITLRETSGEGAARRGLDYYGARSYEPGDPLRDVFWKHTLKLRQLVVKERRSEYGEAVIIAVNMWGGDSEDLDRGAFNMLVSTLTLAREDVPLAFAAYTDEDVVSVTPVLAPRSAVLHALQLIGTMREVARPARVLQPARLARLRRRVGRLKAGGQGAAIGLARVLEFEYLAHVARAERHPAYRAVQTAALKIGAPAALLMASSGPGDPEAVELAVERLRPRGIHSLIALNGAGMPAAVTLRLPRTWAVP